MVKTCRTPAACRPFVRVSVRRSPEEGIDVRLKSNRASVRPPTPRPPTPRGAIRSTHLRDELEEIVKEKMRISYNDSVHALPVTLIIAEYSPPTVKKEPAAVRMRYGLLLLGLAIACSADICDKLMVTIFDGAPPNFIELAECTLERKLAPQTKFKVILVHVDPHDGISSETYLNVIGFPIRGWESMWKFVKPDVKRLVNVPSDEPFAKARECEKKGFKVKTNHFPLSVLYKLAGDQGLLRY
ncbi:unnamed protein product [Cylicocyclus nassatus]|uniref:Uncharacterized protein n=1 Tax=Cylicocyclus nassatus TaxID=53992 RepID=A0AA36MB80_CYLNA|nr:unnamed protein product [Cylicocyclus nassatus]